MGEGLMELTAIVGGTVIDGTGRPPIEDAVVLIVGERIANVFRRSEGVPDGARQVDVAGATILPGLIECHTHVGVLVDNAFLSVPDPAGLLDLFMREYVRYGVTTVRDTGNFDPVHLPLFREGRREWPRFWGAGPILDGPADPPAPWKHLRIVDQPEAARAEVRKLSAEGVDFLKVYVWLKPHVLRAVVEEAHGLGLRVTAHVGHMVTVEQAVKLGVDSLEHVRIGRELVAERDQEALRSLPGRALDPLVSFRAWRYIDPEGTLAERLIALLAERGVFFTPTLTLSQSILKGDVPEVRQPPELERMPAPVREQWEQFRYTFDYTPEDLRQGKEELARQMAFVARAERAGVKVTAGTDATNPFVIPGRSLHEELRLLVDGGVEPLRAIHAATGRAAQLLGQQNELGTIEKRRLADLLVVDGDPLADISATLRIRAVMKSGEVVWGERGLSGSSAAASGTRH
jgi:imidazolonepropionase-like amidohydrolase